MAIYFAENNREGARNLFNKRIIYSAELEKFQKLYPNIVNFNFAEKQLYGKVDRRFVPLVLRDEGFMRLAAFGDGAVGSAGFSAANFVVDAFKDLAQQFRKCAMAGKIDTTDSYLSDLKVYRAYISPQAVYRGTSQRASARIQSYFLSNNIMVKDFEDFMGHLEAYWEATDLTRSPYTLSGFVKSRFCSIMSTGLAVEIADLDPVNDSAKIEDFVKSKNWQFYVNACRSYGFMVDKNIPWRLIADIGSAPMIEYSKKYNLNNTTAVLTLGYSHAHSVYYPNFKYYLLSLYNLIKKKNYSQRVRCSNGNIMNKIIKPSTYTKQNFDNLYSEDYFLKRYFQIRFKEEESHFTSTEVEFLIDDALEVYKASGVDKALTYLEVILNKPFDYRGSLTYIVNEREAADDFSNSG